MNFPSALIEEAVNQLSKFPGVGKKSALRMVLHILKQEPQDVIKLAQAVEQVRTLIKYCKRCHNVSDGELCNICQSHKRNSELVCVVEDLRDVFGVSKHCRPCGFAVLFFWQHNGVAWQHFGA